MALPSAKYCNHCGAILAPEVRYCGTCGQPATAAARRERSGKFVQLGGRELELAGIGSRFGALIVDAIVAAIASLPLLFFYNPWSMFELQPDGRFPNPTYSVAQILLSTTYGLAYTWLWESLGWSPGKGLVGIRIRRIDDHRPGPVHGLARTTIKSLAGMFAIGYLWATWDDQRQALHDKAADTYVIKHNPGEPALPDSPAPALVRQTALWWALGGTVVWFAFQISYVQLMNQWFEWIEGFETEFERNRPMAMAPLDPTPSEVTANPRGAVPTSDYPPVFSSSSTQFPSGSSTIAIRSPGRTSSGPEGTA